MTEINKQIKKHPHIDANSCAGCRVCVENCPKDCLSLSDPKKHGDINIIATLSNADECIGCGICARVCPIEAIKMAEED